MIRSKIENRILSLSKRIGKYEKLAENAEDSKMAAVYFSQAGRLEGHRVALTKVLANLGEDAEKTSDDDDESIDLDAMYRE